MTTTTATDYYALLGVDARRDHRRRSSRPTASWPSSTTRTSTTAPTPLRSSGRSPKPTTPSPTRTGAAATTGSTAPAHPPPATDDGWSRYTGPATAHAPANGSAHSSPGRQPDPEGPGRDLAGDPPLAPGDPRRPSSSSPAAPTASTPAGATTPPAGGTSQASSYAEVMISGEGLRRTPRRGPRHPPARSRPRPGPRPRHQGHLPPGPLPQQALQDLRRAARPGRRARPAQRLVRHHHHRRHRASPTPASSPTWPTP